MKRFSISFLCVLAVVLVAVAPAFAAKPTVGVAEFRNNARAHWWYGGLGWDLADMVTNELAALGSMTVVERAKLEPVLREQDLADYGRVREGTGAQIGQLTGAQYLVLGSVATYEEDSKGGGGGLGYKGIRVGGKKSEAYVAVDLRVVDTTTGEISFTRTVEARAGSKGFNVGLSRSGFSGNMNKFNKTPHGKAIRAVIAEITDYLDCAMVRQDSCMAEFDAKEAKRKQSLKGAVKLD